MVSSISENAHVNLLTGSALLRSAQQASLLIHSVANAFACGTKITVVVKFALTVWKVVGIEILAAAS